MSNANTTHMNNDIEGSARFKSYKGVLWRGSNAWFHRRWLWRKGGVSWSIYVKLPTYHKLPAYNYQIFCKLLKQKISSYWLREGRKGIRGQHTLVWRGVRLCKWTNTDSLQGVLNLAWNKNLSLFFFHSVSSCYIRYFLRCQSCQACQPLLYSWMTVLSTNSMLLVEIDGYWEVVCLTQLVYRKNKRVGVNVRNNVEVII